MYAFQYKHGDRPLEGYTIQRAAGRGGFGEVYYAISDSGREVALKAVTGYEAIELRGIGQCMNLKSPHLVSIFDVKHNADGRPFVLMEFVSGPSLRQLLDEAPSGLGEQKSAFFLREIAKGLTYLHDCGIVHRDLKPANIFYENGYVKIGDYGLSKAMSTSMHSGQTVTVGTVHYMAPEVGAGKYDRGIDIYAMGAVLYEMLTGTPPYVGASPSEVLLKHLSATPDVSGISEPFATVIKKAMARNPDDRYKSVQEMVEGVFGAAHIQQSVSVFSPEELSVVAGRVARHVAVGAGVAGAGGSNPPPKSDVKDPWGQVAQRVEQVGDHVARKMGEFNDRISSRFKGQGASADASRDMTVPIEDPLPSRSRWVLAVLTTGIVSIAGGIFSHSRQPELVGLYIASSIVGAALGMAVLTPFLLPQTQMESRAVRRFMTGSVATLSLFVASFIFIVGGWRSLEMPGTLIAVALPLFFQNVDRWRRPNRTDRISLGPVIGAMVIALVASQTFDGLTPTAIAIATGTGLVVQALAPWDPRRVAMAAPALKKAPAAGGAGPSPVGTIATPAAAQVRQTAQPATPAAAANPSMAFWSRPVPSGVRMLWFGAFALLFSLAIALFVAAGNSRSGQDYPTACAGFVFLALSLVCGSRSLIRNFYGAWPYFFRPLFLGMCATTIIDTGIILGNARRLDSTGEAVGAFVIVFCVIAGTFLLFLPGRKYLVPPAVGPAPAPAAPPIPVSQVISPSRKLPALVLNALIFGGVGGLHRFYVGKIGTGILWLFTGGLLGIGQLVDAILILTDNFTDKHGRRVVIWDDPKEAGLDSRIVAQLQAEVKPASPMIAPQVPLTYHALGLLSALAGLLFFVAWLIGIALAIDLPGAVAQGAFGSQVASETLREFDGYMGWPSLVYKLVFMGLSVLTLFAVTAMLFARRIGGFTHMLRGCIGAAAMIFSLVPLHAAFRRIQWPGVVPFVDNNRPLEAMDAVLNQVNGGVAVVSLLIFVFAIAMLVWPARRPNFAVPAPKAG